MVRCKLSVSLFWSLERVYPPEDRGWQMERAPTPYQTRRAVRVVTGTLNYPGPARSRETPPASLLCKLQQGTVYSNYLYVEVGLRYLLMFLVPA
jgi:hypothetical protein